MPFTRKRGEGVLLASRWLATSECLARCTGPECWVTRSAGLRPALPPSALRAPSPASRGREGPRVGGVTLQPGMTTPASLMKADVPR
jgi:hypothetical protein